MKTTKYLVKYLLGIFLREKYLVFFWNNRKKRAGMLWNYFLMDLDEQSK